MVPMPTHNIKRRSRHEDYFCSPAGKPVAHGVNRELPSRPTFPPGGHLKAGKVAPSGSLRERYLVKRQDRRDRRIRYEVRLQSVDRYSPEDDEQSNSSSASSGEIEGLGAWEHPYDAGTKHGYNLPIWGRAVLRNEHHSRRDHAKILEGVEAGPSERAAVNSRLMELPAHRRNRLKVEKQRELEEEERLQQEELRRNEKARLAKVKDKERERFQAYQRMEEETARVAEVAVEDARVSRRLREVAKESKLQKQSKAALPLPLKLRGTADLFAPETKAAQGRDPSSALNIIKAVETARQREERRSFKELATEAMLDADSLLSPNPQSP